MLLNIRVRCFFISFRDKSQDKSIKEFETKNDARKQCWKTLWRKHLLIWVLCDTNI